MVLRVGNGQTNNVDRRQTKTDDKQRRLAAGVVFDIICTCDIKIAFTLPLEILFVK